MQRFGIGIIGCGNIAATYLRNAALFPALELRVCADLNPAAAEARAREFGIRSASVDALLAADDVDIVVNLTVPNAHYDITLAALSAGKHVYTEKPLATNAQLGGKLVEAAAERNLALASAPDTFMGAAGRRARRLIDEGAIGRPVTGTAFMFGHGMEHWHPNPHFYYQPGGGPVLDMGPYYLTMLVNLLGPATRVVGMSAIGAGERIVTAEGPSKGSRIPVGTPTTVMSVLEFTGGATVTVGMSWDVWRHGNPNIELHGTEGSLRLPDPDAYGGLVELSSGGAEWRHFSTENAKYGGINWPFDAPRLANYRMLGVAEMVAALQAGRTPRASGELALHVLEILEAMLQSAEGGAAIILPKREARPCALSEADAAALGVE